MKHLIKVILVAAGSIFVVLGVAGIFLPLLPTTPFLLLAAICYVRSSQKLYDKLINNKLLGSYIKNYLNGGGIPLRSKIISISLLWLTIGYSVIFLMQVFWLKLILLLIAAGVTTHILWIKTSRELDRK